MPTPNRKVLFYDATYDLIEVPVAGGTRRIRIWITRDLTPDKVTVAVG